MKLSIIIPVYNAEKYLKETLDSLVNQTIDSFELIIVNDGSKDDTAKIANELVKLSKTKNGSIVTLIDKENSKLKSEEKNETPNSYFRLYKRRNI